MGATLLDVTVLGEPVGQGRPRAVKMPFGVRMHPAKKSAEWESLAAQRLADMWQRAPHAEVCRLTVFAVNARPKSIVKALGRGSLWRAGKPDLDNVIKSAMDALVKAGVLRDDTLVAEIRATNVIAAESETPHVRIVVEELVPVASVRQTPPYR